MLEFPLFKMNSNENEQEEIINLSTEDEIKLKEQNKRLVTPFKVQQLEINAQKHWDLFYKRNEDRFFKDRHWTTNEFEELLQDDTSIDNELNWNKDICGCHSWNSLLEIGCGVGNFLFPLVEKLDKLGMKHKQYYACDISPRAIKFMESHYLYDASRMNFFQCNITTPDILQKWIPKPGVDIVTMIFVMSAISPEKFSTVIKEIYEILRPGGLVLFRDYGRHDMAQLRFKPGHKIADNFYMRQDGTRSYFFSVEELSELFRASGFDIVSNQYVLARTCNRKESINLKRIFVQGKFKKP